MIETMNKLYLVIRNHNVSEVLGHLQNLGVIHIEHGEIDQSLIHDDIHFIQEVQAFNRHFKEPPPDQLIYQGDIKEVLAKHFAYRDQIEERNQEEAKLLRFESLLMPWGNTNADDLRKLEESGITLNYYITTLNKLDSLKLDKIPHEIINQIGDKIYLVTVNRSYDPDRIGELPMEKTLLPNLSLSEVRNKIAKLRNEKKDLVEKNNLLGKYYNHVQASLNQYLDKIDFFKAKSGLTDYHESFSTLIGWIPENRSMVLENELTRDENLVYIIEKNIPKDEYNKVPILLKNNKFNQLFEPITKLFMLPAYAELDLTPFFAPFFVMFFGMCLGDSGYGLFMSLLFLVGFFKFKKLRPIFALGIFLGLSTTFWGILTGTFVGINLFETKLPIMSDMAMFTSEHMFYLALMIGLFQILFGTIVQAINKWIQEGVWASLSPLGFFIFFIFLVLWYLKTQTPENAGDPTFKIGYALIKQAKNSSSGTIGIGMSLGLFLVFFFNDVHAKVYIRPLKGLWALYNALTGFLGDLLSYIRLFALGISSGILGFVINSIGSEFLKIPIPVLNYVIFIVFVTVGHTANLGLASLGSFVHPLRLTFVEFYKNAGFAGGGRTYSPFKKTK
ncbi:MAG: hypothetical protein A2381_06465 [Bdellovibrionales bacterium RIFOXYB1_FULL_37_110]|nr:MAG: hypothetical protein A2181_08485 [Bdellovibrionales bacterium RIFOXYA1_FULL_38_20]OFZ50185.1 MAG: hypothetical protein A2417_19315 [Bdellovibrionales bacterium RIFOXYC1_FULL_37_79]OFZ57622.1 MAG: hypothetical protein A2381_06465 [Bdellovibrionales bacterium RIFOXYB1_FULL_37_110]OFZ61389.1 MAG: hypothetical protein A2577_00830 [Bdellovibrionales bacterium RIFOXYD1_FULL_36_51]